MKQAQQNNTIAQIHTHIGVYFTVRVMNEVIFLTPLRSCHQGSGQRFSAGIWHKVQDRVYAEVLGNVVVQLLLLACHLPSAIFIYHLEVTAKSKQRKNNVKISC